jgi:hypothetical protein
LRLYQRLPVAAPDYALFPDVEEPPPECVSCLTPAVRAALTS